MRRRCQIGLALLFSLVCLAVVAYLTPCMYPKQTAMSGSIRQRIESSYGQIVQERRQSGVLLPPPGILRVSALFPKTFSSLRQRPSTLYRQDYLFSTNAVPWVSIQVCDGRVYCLVLAFNTSVSQDDVQTLRDILAGVGVRTVEWPTAPAGTPPLLGIDGGMGSPSGSMGS